MASGVHRVNIQVGHEMTLTGGTGERGVDVGTRWRRWGSGVPIRVRLCHGYSPVRECDDNLSVRSEH